MKLFKSLIQLLALTYLFFSCNKKDNSILKSEMTNIQTDSITEIKNVFDNSIIRDSTVWNQYKIIREVEEDTAPYSNCKIVLIDNIIFKYYIKNKLKFQDSIKFIKKGSNGNKLYGLKLHDSCVFFNKSKEIITLSSCNPNSSFITEYFKKENLIK